MLVVTGLNTDDKRRIAKLEGKNPRNMPKTTPKEETARKKVERRKRLQKKRNKKEDKRKRESEE